MRSTLEILIAVKESRPVEHEELRLALMALDGINHFTQDSLNALIDAVESGTASAKLRAKFAIETRERMFQAIKSDPSKWLGPEWTPGNPEHDERYRIAIAIGRAAGAL